MTPKQIAAKINFPISVEWHGYANDYSNAIGAYQGLSPSEIKKWKKDPKGYIDEFDLSPGSDDDWDYVKPWYAYLNGRLILAVANISDLPSTSINKVDKYEAIKQAFVIDFKSGNERNRILHFYDDMIGEDLVDEVQEAWSDIAHSFKTVREAYNNGKVSKEFGQMAKSFSNSDWQAVEFYVNALEAAY
jgi:hypothetical protein